MPLLRYFLFVGGALLALILICGAVLPQEPLPGTLTAGGSLPPVRIHSDRKLPERVVFDTSSTVSTTPIPVLRTPKVAGVSPAPTPAATVEISAKARVREAFAQLPPEEEVAEPKMDQMAQAVLPGPKMYKVKPAPRRAAAVRPNVRIAQQPHVGFLQTW